MVRVQQAAYSDSCSLRPTCCSSSLLALVSESRRPISDLACAVMRSLTLTLSPIIRPDYRKYLSLMKLLLACVVLRKVAACVFEIRRLVQIRIISVEI